MMWILRTVAIGIFMGCLFAYRDPKLLDPETASLLYVLSSLSVGLFISSMGWPLIERFFAPVVHYLNKE